IDLSLEFNEVVREPKPDVLFNDFGDSALDLKLTFTINNSFSSNMVKSAIRYRIYEVFNENNIEIPFPQRTVWMNKS
ncbi:mechanosensitive ion channel, partial [Flavobacteriaceae bacterium]|nr:mechanosensitive ion channel [Flavobacteriaceae bacterium]